MAVRFSARHWLVASLALTVMLVGCRTEEAPLRSGRVVVLGLDGLDPEVVDELVEAGELPSFARLRSTGSLGPLRSFDPLLSPVIWTTVATGRPPRDHGITGFVTAREGAEHPVTSRLRRTKALWTIASEAGDTVAVVGWWATWPAETVDGAIVSDRTGLHFLLADEGQDLSLPGLTHPPELAAEVAPFVRSPALLDPEALVGFVNGAVAAPSVPFAFADPESHLRWAVATAESYADIGLHLWSTRRPDLLLVYLEAVDTVSHLFGHLHRREDLVGELADQADRFGGAVTAAYRLVDRELGRVMDALDEETTLVVLSDHGFRLGVLPEDPKRTLAARGVSHELHRPDGVLGLVGRGVRPGARADGATILDVAPTVLSLLGLPASLEMPGRVLNELLTEPAPEPRVATYESAASARGAEVGEAASVDQELVRKLEALGYLGGTGAGKGVDRNDAVLALADHRYREAAGAFRELLEADPLDARLHNGLGAALAGLGRDDAALESFERALDLDPALVSAVFNRGLLAERRGELDSAVADYRTALRYDSGHRAARLALERLGVPAAPTPVTEEEQRVAVLLRTARDAARRGDYQRAGEALDEAEALLPDAAVVHQYRANVAYVRGDREGAIAALERALELEPENASLRRNLERLTRPRESP